MKILAVDPGLHGGVAVIRDRDVWVARAMPLAGKTIDAAAFAKIALAENPDLAVVEQVAARPGQGVVSMFTFGTGYGMILGALAAVGIRTELVRPQAWKKLVLAGTTKDKNAAIAYCRRAFPHTSLLATPKSRVPSDGIADALCIAEYGRRVFTKRP